MTNHWDGHDGTCREWQPRLSEFVDGEFDAPEARAVAAHLEACDACRSLADELRRIAAVASVLAAPAPPARDLWPGIASRLTPVPASAPRRPTAYLALAAALVLGVGAAVWVARSPAGIKGPETTRAGGAAVAGDAQAYNDEVAGLRRVIHDRLTHDPGVVERLETDLTTIDTAVAEYRDALASTPWDAELVRRLHDARQRKLRLLQQAAQLAPLDGN
jgi:hypothetical protein